MDISNELRDLCRNLRKIDRDIIKMRAERGSEDIELRKEFFKIRDQIENLLSESYAPFDNIQDSEIVTILKNVRHGNHFILDKESRKFESMLRNLPRDFFEEFLEKRGIKVTEEEIDEYIDKENKDFIEELTEKLDASEYNDRKKLLSTIVVGQKLPNNFSYYFREVRECFLFNQFYAAIGFCRVLLEVAYKGKFNKLGLAKSSNNFYDIRDYRLADIIHDVCKTLHAEGLRKESFELFKKCNQILHGTPDSFDLNPDVTRTFIQRTFNVVESLYA